MELLAKLDLEGPYVVRIPKSHIIPRGLGLIVVGYSMRTSDMKIMLVGDISSPHLLRWIAPLTSHGYTIAVAGFGKLSEPGTEFFSLGPRLPAKCHFALGISLLKVALRRASPALVHAHYTGSYGVMAALAVGKIPLALSAW